MGSSMSVAHADGCPVDHENMSPEQIAAFMAQHEREPLPPEHPPVSKTRDPAKPDDEKMSSEESGMVQKNENAGNENAGQRKKREMYDVYGQKLDTSNLMPATPNQLPSPGQKEPLSTDRVQSSIPKSGGDDHAATWVYPSPQMFFNALKRKGKAADVEESDVPTVVAVHNRMNEQTWQEVLQWETRFHCDECATPKLKRFQGRPHDLSPVARFRSMLRGYPRPFDRHDWVVDRCGKEDVRYVIDYYFIDGPSPIEIHVRPAVDSLSAAYDRFRQGILFVRRSMGLPVPDLPSLPVDNAVAQTKSNLPAPHSGQIPDASAHPQSEHLLSTMPSVVKGEQVDMDEFSFLTQLTTEKLYEIGEDVQSQCKNTHTAFITAVQSGADATAIEKANMSLNYCMAQRICKSQAVGFMNALENNVDATDAYGEMTSCLDRFQIMAQRAILDAAGVEQSGPEFPSDGVPSVTLPAQQQSPLPKSTAPTSGAE